MKQPKFTKQELASHRKDARFDISEIIRFMCINLNYRRAHAKRLCKPLLQAMIKEINNQNK